MGILRNYKEYRQRKIFYKSEVDRLNYKADTLTAKFGYDSPIVQDYYSDILTIVPEKYIRYKNGVPHIMKPSKLAKEGIDLTDLTKVKGYAEVKKDYEERYNEYLKEEEFDIEFREDKTPPVSIDSFIRGMMSISDMLNMIKAISGSGARTENEERALDVMKHPLKSYGDLLRVTEMLQS